MDNVSGEATLPVSTISTGSTLTEGIDANYLIDEETLLFYLNCTYTKFTKQRYSSVVFLYFTDFTAYFYHFHIFIFLFFFSYYD